MWRCLGKESSRWVGVESDFDDLFFLLRALAATTELPSAPQLSVLSRL